MIPLNRSQFRLTVPSKTFLLGEYACLHGGPAVILAHGPRFVLEVSPGDEASLQGIHPQSPAGQWLRSRSAAVKARGEWAFHDPHGGAGGYGASSAQFVAVRAATYLAGRAPAEATASEVESLWREYRQLDHGSENLPSGGDVVAQYLGGAVVFRAMPFAVTSRAWPFSDLQVLLVRTGVKVATHEHLRERLPVSDQLLELAESGARAFELGARSDFLAAVTAFGEELERLQLVTMRTRGLIAEIAGVPGVLAVKGCGALGADVLSIWVQSDHAATVRATLAGKGLTVVADSDDLSSGLMLEMALALGTKSMERNEACP